MDEPVASPVPSTTQVPPPKKKMPTWLKVLIAAGVILIGVPLLFFVSFIFFGVLSRFLYHDIAPIDDSDLIPTTTTNPLPKERNGYYLMQKLEQVPEGDGEAAFLAVDSVERSSDGYVDDSLLNPESYSTLSSSVTPPLNSYRRTVLDASTYLLKMSQEGDSTKALWGAVSVMSASHSMGDARTHMLDQFVSYAMITTASEAMVGIASNYKGDTFDLRRAEGYLRAYVPSDESLVEAVRVDYVGVKKDLLSYLGEFQGKAIFNEEHPELKLNSFTFFPNETVGYQADDRRVMIRVFTDSCSAIKNVKYAEQRINFESAFLIFTPNSIGKMLNNHGTESVVKTVKGKQCATKVAVMGARSVLLLRAYEIEKGGLPAQESEYLSLMDGIIDPYSNSAFLFDSTARMLRSVGQDGVPYTEDDLTMRF